MYSSSELPDNEEKVLRLSGELCTLCNKSLDSEEDLLIVSCLLRRGGRSVAALRTTSGESLNAIFLLSSGELLDVTSALCSEPLNRGAEPDFDSVALEETDSSVLSCMLSGRVWALLRESSVPIDFL